MEEERFVLPEPVEARSVIVAAKKAYEELEGEGALKRYGLVRSGPLGSRDGRCWEVGILRPIPVPPHRLATVLVDRKTGTCSVEILHSIADAMKDRGQAAIDQLKEDGSNTRESDMGIQLE